MSEEQTKNENKFTINLKIPFMTKHLFLENGCQLNLRIFAVHSVTLASGKCKDKWEVAVEVEIRQNVNGTRITSLNTVPRLCDCSKTEVIGR